MKIPYTNIHAQEYLIPADYESGKGLSSGLLVEAQIPHTPVAIGAERSYNWKSGRWSTDRLAFANKDAGSARLGAVDIGAVADQHGNVGGYGGVGPIGGGITFSLGFLSLVVIEALTWLTLKVLFGSVSGFYFVS